MNDCFPFVNLAIYGDDVNLLYENVNTIKKTLEAVFDPNKESGLEVNVEKKVCICLCLVIRR